MPPELSKQVFYSVVIGGNVHDVTGRKRTHKGYIALCIKSHPYSDFINGYVFEHRVVMETLLGRYLEQNEIVHHKNEVKHDNRLSNLEVMNHTDHTVMHHKGLKRTEETKAKISEKARQRENPSNYKVIDKNQLVELLKNNGPKRVAEILGISRKTVYNKIKEFDLKGDL